MLPYILLKFINQFVFDTVVITSNKISGFCTFLFFFVNMFCIVEFPFTIL